MGALPKRKVSRHRRGNRRKHLVLTPPTLVKCPTCSNMMRAHRVCKDCGQFKGRQIVALAEAQDTER